MEHCDGCVEEKKRKAHAAQMRKWVVDNRRIVHSRYMNALALFDTVHSRPHKFVLAEADTQLKLCLL